MCGKACQKNEKSQEQKHMVMAWKPTDSLSAYDGMKRGNKTPFFYQGNFIATLDIITYLSGLNQHFPTKFRQDMPHQIFLFFIQKLFRQSHLEILCKVTEVVRRDRLQLCRGHGQHFHQNLCRFLDCVEQPEGQVKVLP